MASVQRGSGELPICRRYGWVVSRGSGGYIVSEGLSGNDPNPLNWSIASAASSGVANLAKHDPQHLQGGIFDRIF